MVVVVGVVVLVFGSPKKHRKIKNNIEHFENNLNNLKEVLTIRRNLNNPKT